MTDLPTGHDPTPARYQIRLDGHLAPRWASWFEGMTLTRDTDGTTLIDGAVVDQAALHGLLSKLRDIGLPLIGVTQIQPDPSGPLVTPQGD